MTDTKQEGEENMEDGRVLDDVWTEEGGLMLRVLDLGGFVRLDFHNPAPKDLESIVFTATVAKYRWERLLKTTLDKQ